MSDAQLGARGAKTEQPPEILIVEIDKSNRETIRVALTSYEGTPTLSIWRWYRMPSGELRPGKGGLVVGLRHLPALADALASALAAARARAVFPLRRLSAALYEAGRPHCAAPLTIELDQRCFCNGFRSQGPEWRMQRISATAPMRESMRTGGGIQLGKHYRLPGERF